MVEHNLMDRDASDFQAFEDLLTADASLRALARQLTLDTIGGEQARPERIAENLLKCRALLTPALGKFRDALYSPPAHAKANV